MWTSPSGPWGDGPDAGSPSSGGSNVGSIERRRGVALRVRLLGRIEIELADGAQVRLTGRHAQALFALLVLCRRPRSRDVLAAELWPEANGPSSAALRQALWLVRNAFTQAGVGSAAILEVEPETIALRPEVRIDLDTDLFEACVRSDDCRTETAIELYRGDLAEGLGHECFASERERLSDMYEDALAEVSQRRLADGRLVGARAAAEQLLARDMLREEAHAVIIAVHGLVGSRSQVVRQYRRLHAVLDRELGVEPLPETEATYRLALDRTLQRSTERASVIVAPAHPTLIAVNA